jgi:hypothetical protein
MFSKTVPRLTSPATAAPASSTSTGTTTTTTTSTPQNTTNVDVRAQQNQEAVSGTFASGSTSALGPLAGTSTVVGGPFGTGTTSGASATGTTATTTGTTTAGALGAPTIVGFGALGTSPNGGLVVAPITAIPSDVTTGSAMANTTLASSTPTFTNADIVGASLAQNGIAVTERTGDPRSFDRAVDMVKRDRLRAGRNGQLVYSVAPRTNVDRTWQMPDDGPGPSLTGSNSTLTR